ncbi:hypothetical protein IU459_02725 [Nocardia amamiensis]|uniref:Uncharacterized protein n=1 Tax=Nocardia amamiensis TaxID=404578 RepID=A0ABS0CIL5_9NOCA|nr:hypothetical protein [Nocardia amamiensis]MBF6296453.1 hypothetical protein [Nocardia amamiensis]
MRYIMSRLGAALAAIIAALLAGTGSVGAVPASVRAPACDLRIVYDKPTVLAPLVIADAAAVCDHAPDRHTVEFSLDYYNSGTWVRQALIYESGVPTRGRRIDYHVSAECRVGDWRAVARATGSMQGRPFDARFISQTRSISRTECPGG